MARGWSMLARLLVTPCAMPPVHAGDEIVTTFANGTARSRVEDPIVNQPPAPVAAGYAEALAELEAILTDLERTDVDVDVLATQVTRAAELIGFCRDRIGNARLPDRAGRRRTG